MAPAAGDTKAAPRRAAPRQGQGNAVFKDKSKPSDIRESNIIAGKGRWMSSELESLAWLRNSLYLHGNINVLEILCSGDMVMGMVYV